jgi:hypothetical protein
MIDKSSDDKALQLVAKLADQFNRISMGDFTTIAHPEARSYAAAIKTVLNKLGKPLDLRGDVDTADDLARKLGKIGSSDFQSFHAPEAKRYGQSLTNIVASL